MKVVIDCNILISAGLTDGTCRKVINEIVKNHECFISKKIIAEYRNVTTRRKFKVNKHIFISLIQHILKPSLLVNPLPCPFEIPHENDKVYLETALSANVDILVTGNKKHFPLAEYGGVKILTPRDFLEQHTNLEILH